jgi:hypothetical protein
MLLTQKKVRLDGVPPGSNAARVSPRVTDGWCPSPRAFYTREIDFVKRRWRIEQHVWDVDKGASHAPGYVPLWHKESRIFGYRSMEEMFSLYGNCRISKSPHPSRQAFEHLVPQVPMIPAGPDTFWYLPMYLIPYNKPCWCMWTPISFIPNGNLVGSPWYSLDATVRLAAMQQSFILTYRYPNCCSPE